MIFSPDTKREFASAYPEQPVLLRHELQSHDAFALDRLVTLAQRLPEQNVEYNSGQLSVDQHPEDTPSNGLSIAETITSIEENGSWMVLKNVESDPE